ncbi:hypothetical protein D9611_003024 [Ephemerocybe angulata]|uniref:Uncharacterized protein n=1 Tax=Ephemerocybe angulata TaxID=980116 RepID=A0A8H5CA31_9AGAR|nr:hypothetical protein D9611_003024 [Tulosesus angulatus]
MFRVLESESPLSRSRQRPLLSLFSRRAKAVFRCPRPRPLASTRPIQSSALCLDRAIPSPLKTNLDPSLTSSAHKNARIGREPGGRRESRFRAGATDLIEDRPQPAFSTKRQQISHLQSQPAPHGHISSKVSDEQAPQRARKTDQADGKPPSEREVRNENKRTNGCPSLARYSLKKPIRRHLQNPSSHNASPRADRRQPDKRSSQARHDIADRHGHRAELKSEIPRVIPDAAPPSSPSLRLWARQPAPKIITTAPTDYDDGGTSSRRTTKGEARRPQLSATTTRLPDRLDDADGRRAEHGSENTNPRRTTIVQPCHRRCDCGHARINTAKRTDHDGDGNDRTHGEDATLALSAMPSHCEPSTHTETYKTRRSGVHPASARLVDGGIAASRRHER